MEDFADEILLKILSHFNAETLVQCSYVCKRWNQVAKSQWLWRKCVLWNWPSQRWLYNNAATYDLNWYKTYQELLQYSWYSPDEMRYFVSCNTIEDELISPILREAMAKKVDAVSRKWMQVARLDHNGDEVTRSFDKNMELYFNTRQLKWVFLDKRRGYMGDLFSYKMKRERQNKKSYFIRPYQVIPSCLLMYRWLSLFCSLATPESGLTFYRIWRFRMKHVETGLIFELCDWKAAMSCTFINGRPNGRSFREDCLDLLHVLAHPNFIMRPCGLNPRIQKTFLYVIHASAGGSVNVFKNKRPKTGNKRRKRALAPSLSPSASSSFLLGKQYDQVCFPDLDERLERWRARRRISLVSATTSLNPSRALDPFQLREGSMSRGSSCSNLTSEAESTTDGSQREITTSDCDSEFDFHENGYVSNCEYFISNSHSFDTVEEQHSLQASVSDCWMYTQKELSQMAPVLFDVDDNNWCIQSEQGFQFSYQHPVSPLDTADIDQRAKMLKLDSDHQDTLSSTVENLQVPAFISSTPTPPMSPPPTFSPVLYNNLSGGVIEAIPSALALYRLVCLFELDCSMYISADQFSVWRITMLHKKTGGLIHFKDYNGVFQVYVSFSEIEASSQQNEQNEGDKGVKQNNVVFDLTEFRTAVTQLLHLLMSDSFCHPYGTIAGAVA